MSSPLDDLAGEISVDKLAEGFPPTVHRYGVLVSHTSTRCVVAIDGVEIPNLRFRDGLTLVDDGTVIVAFTGGVGWVDCILA